MRRTILSFAATLSILGTLQAPVAEAHGWFHPLRDVEHAAHATMQFGSDAKSAVLQSHSTPLLIAGGVLVGLSMIAGAPVYAVMGGLALGVVYLDSHDQFKQIRQDRSWAREEAKARQVPEPPMIGYNGERATGSKTVVGADQPDPSYRGPVGLPGAAGGTTTNAGFKRH